MKPILYILINIILFVGFSENIQAQEVENPQEELINNEWYLTKLVIEEEEFFFIPNQNLQNINLFFQVDDQFLITEFSEINVASYEFEDNENFYTWDWGSMASMSQSSNNNFAINENISDQMYLNVFWKNNEDNSPYYYTYTITQAENDKKLIITNENNDKAYYQSTPLSVENQEKYNLVFYPNPAQEEIYIENLTEAAEIEIYTISGKKLLQQQVNSSTESINISNLSAGVYLYSFVQNGKKIKTGKLVKE